MVMWAGWWCGLGSHGLECGRMGNDGALDKTGIVRGGETLYRGRFEEL